MKKLSSLPERAWRSVRRIDPKRAAVHVAIVLAATYALYLLLFNAALSTPILRSLINKKPEKLLVEYTRAWTLWPGRVQVRNLKLRTETTDAEVYVAFDELGASFDLPSLLKKHLRVRDIDATTTVVRVRPRVLAENWSDAMAEGYAEIPGYDRPPLRSTEPRDPPFSNDDYDAWTIELRDVRLHTREVWIGPYRYAGDATVKGGFYLRPQRLFALFPSTLEAHSGELTLAKRPFGHDVRGTASATIAMHDPRAVSSDEMLRYLDAELKLESAIPDLGFMQRWLGPEASTFVAGGEGHARSDARVERGVLRDGSTFDIKSERVIVRNEKEGAVWTDALGEIRVEEGEATVDIALTDLRVERRYAAAYPMRADRIRLLARSSSLDLARAPFDDVLLSVDVPKLRVTDLRALYGIFGESVKLGPGTGSLRAELHYSVAEELLAGEASVEASRLSFETDDLGVSMRLAAGVRVKSMNLASMRGEIPHAYIDIRDGVVKADEGEPPPPWWGRLDVRDIDVRSGEPAMSGPFLFHARDARPAVYIVAAKSALPQWAREPLAMEGLTLRGVLALSPGIAVEKLSGKGGAIEIGGHVKKAKGEVEGAIKLSLGPLNATVKLGPDKGVTPGIGGGPQP